VSTVAAYDIFRLYNLRATLLLPAIRDEIFGIIVCQVTPEKTVIDSGTLALSRFGLVLGKISQLDCDGIVV
jgi:hypothetical protein